MKNIKKKLNTFIIWLTGKNLFIPKSSKTGGMVLNVIKPVIFEYTPCGDWYSMTAHVTGAPNIIHRLLQRFILGVKYRML